MHPDQDSATTLDHSDPLDATLSDENLSADQQVTPDTANRSHRTDSAADLFDGADNKVPGGGNNSSDGDASGNNPNTEAAKWRRKLRDTETELAAAHERITRYQRTEIERLATEHLAVPADLFDIARVELPALLDDNNDPDPAKVRAAVDELLNLRPGLSKHAKLPPRPRHPNYGQGSPPGYTRDSGSSWNELLS